MLQTLNLNVLKLKNSFQSHDDDLILRDEYSNEIFESIFQIVNIGIDKYFGLKDCDKINMWLFHYEHDSGELKKALTYNSRSKTKTTTVSCYDYLSNLANKALLAYDCIASKPKFTRQRS